MKLLITGGAGFIGSNFIRFWLAHHSGDSVVNFDKLTYAGNLKNLGDIESDERYTFVRSDIVDSAAVDTAMQDVDVVVHFAAESHVDRSIAGPAEFVHTNIVGTQVLLDMAVRNNIKRFHHISTDEVFGQIALDDDARFDELSRYEPRSPYAASKAASDHLVRAYHATYGLPITITNCSNNYGPYHFPEKFIPLAITNILEEKKIPLYSPGNQVRDWLYVEDHCKAIERVLLDGEIGETYCVGGMSDEISNKEVAEMIIEQMGASYDMIELVKDRPGHDVKYAVDWSKIKRTLSWKPEVTFEEGLAKTIKWFTEHKSWWKPLKHENEKYFNQQYEKK